MRTGLQVLLIAAIIGLGGLGASYILMPRQNVPEEFVQARTAAGNLAKQIVERSSQSMAILSEISVYDRQGDRTEALNLISKEVIAHRAAQQDAIELSTQLEVMARLLSQIRPERARVVATEAVSAEVAIVSHLLAYNNYLLQLFETLRSKFQNPGLSSNGHVNDLISKINEEARAINELNGRSTSALASFDEVFK